MILDKITESNPYNVIIRTDQNFDYFKLKTNKNINEVLNIFIQHGLVPKITQPTQTSSSTSTLIDNIHVKSNNSGQNQAGILRSDLPDH